MGIAENAGGRLTSGLQSVPEPLPAMHQIADPRAAAVERVAFSGERAPFRRLVMRGAGLELVTVGFYRFWLATDIRRHLWSHTEVGGDPAEYTGRPRELLIGFLIAMAILVPVYLVYFLIGLEAERLQAFASIPLLLFFFLFSEFARYRARRYRLTRTVWRGLRFSMGGSGWSYSWRSALWWLPVILSLGLALPWRLAALERFKMRHAAYGSLQGRFDGTGGGLFKQVWWIWLSAVLVLAVYVGTPILAPPTSRANIVLWLILSVVAFLLSPFLYAAFKAIQWRWWVSGIRFGDVRFGSRLEAGGLNGCYWKVIGWLALLLLVFSLWIGWVYWIVSQLFALDGPGEQRMLAALQHPAFMVGGGVGYLLVAVAVGAVVRLYLNRDVWARVAQSTLVYNLAAADDVSGQGETVGAVGEGFADSLDIAGF